jgi:hypothetical protein
MISLICLRDSGAPLGAQGSGERQAVFIAEPGAGREARLALIHLSNVMPGLVPGMTNSDAGARS